MLQKAYFSSYGRDLLYEMAKIWLKPEDAKIARRNHCNPSNGSLPRSCRHRRLLSALEIVAQHLDKVPILVAGLSKKRLQIPFRWPPNIRCVVLCLVWNLASGIWASLWPLFLALRRSYGYGGQCCICVRREAPFHSLFDNSELRKLLVCVLRFFERGGVVVTSLILQLEDWLEMAAVAATVQVQSLGTVCVQGSSSRLLGGKPLCLAPLPSTATRGASLVVRAGSGLPSPTKVNSFCPPPLEPALRLFFVSVSQSKSRWNCWESASQRDFHIFRFFLVALAQDYWTLNPSMTSV